MGTQGNYDGQHPACCVQAALQCYHISQYNLSQLQSAQRQLQTVENELQHTQQLLHTTQVELQREREESEIANQQFLELEECHFKLKRNHESVEALNEELTRSVRQSQAYTKEVSERAEGLINHLRAKSTGVEVAEMHNGQSVSGMILESAKNALLVAAMSGSFGPEDQITKLKYVMDQNVDFQQRNMELSKQVEFTAIQLEDRHNEVVNLKKALELTTDDRQRRKPRRGKGKTNLTE